MGRLLLRERERRDRGARPAPPASSPGLRLDSQLGQVGDLTVGEGNELVSFGEGNGMSRWRLDGTGPVAAMVVPRATSVAGYDETGRVVDVVPLGTFGPPHRMVDVATGEEVGRFDVGARTSWVGDGTLALLTQDRGTLLGHVGSDEPVRPESPSVWHSDWPYPDHDPATAWVVPNRHPHQLTQFDVRTGATTGQVVRVPGGTPWFVRNTDAGQKLLVSYYTGVTGLSLDQAERFRVQVFDVDDGSAGPDVAGFTAAAPETSGGVGPVVVADVGGGLQEVDPVTMEPRAALPGLRRPGRVPDVQRRRVPAARDRRQPGRADLRQRDLDPHRRSPRRRAPTTVR